MDNLKLAKEPINKKAIILGLVAIAIISISIIVFSLLEYYFPNFKTLIGLIYYFLNITR